MGRRGVVSRFRLRSRCGPAKSRPRTVRHLIENFGRNGRFRALLNIANSNGAFAVTGIVTRLGGPALVLTRGGALTTRLCKRVGRFFPRGTIRCFISCCSCCRPRTCIPSSSACVTGSSSVGSRVSGLHLSTATTVSRQGSMIIVSSISYVCKLNSPRRFFSVVVSLHPKVAGSESRMVQRLVSVRCAEGRVSFRQDAFHIHKSALRVFPTGDSSATIEMRFFKSRVSHVSRVSMLAKRVGYRHSRVDVFPTSRCMIPTRRVRETTMTVRRRLGRHMRCFGDRSGLLRTRQVSRHAGFSVRVVGRAKFYSKVRGCSERLSKLGPKRPPCALLSCFKSSFLLVVSRSRVAMPRMKKVCTNSRDEGRALMSCKFQLPSTGSGHPLDFRRFRSGLSRIVFMSTAPKRCRCSRRLLHTRRVVHPAKLLSPGMRIHPVRKRVSSLVKRMGGRISGGRGVLVAALAGQVTRSLARCVGRMKVQIHCLRSSVSALRHTHVVHSVHLSIFSMLMKVGLLQRNLSVPRVALMTVLSTSGRNFLHSRASLVRAVKQTTQGDRNRMVVCTSGVASSVRGTVARAGHHQAVRRTCGGRRKVAPAAVGGTIHSLVTMSGTMTRARIQLRGSPRSVAHGRLAGLVARMRGRVHTTTTSLGFRRTTRLHSGVVSLGGGLSTLSG